MSELKENVLSEVPTEKQASQTDLAVLSDPVQTDLEANQSDEADNYNFANQKFANIRSDVHIVSLDRRSTVQTEADTEMKYLLDLLASLRSRHILTGKLEGVESSEAGDPRAVLEQLAQVPRTGHVIADSLVLQRIHVAGHVDRAGAREVVVVGKELH